jgi:hypothetical protein
MTKQLPKIGETYKFYDDGKITLSRQYNAIVEQIIPVVDSIYIMLHSHIIGDATLFEIYKYAIDNQSEFCKIYADETDFFIGCKIPNYEDDYLVWFVRDKFGGWTSLEIENYWEVGDLDIDGKMTKESEEN